MAYQIVGKLTKCVLFILVPFIVYLHMRHYCLHSIKRLTFPDSGRLCFLSDFLFTSGLFTYVSLEFIYQLHSILFVKIVLVSHNIWISIKLTLMIADIFKLISLNVRGINNFQKRRTMFLWYRRKKSHLVFLQETF